MPSPRMPSDDCPQAGICRCHCGSPELRLKVSGRVTRKSSGCEGLRQDGPGKGAKHCRQHAAGCHLNCKRRSLRDRLRRGK